MEKERLLVSACLLGLKCRYDGGRRPLDAELIDLLMKRFELVPVCPEQLGGLTTPREPSERRGMRVVMRSGRDVTAEYERGAQEALRLARLFSCRQALLKERSPSCGSGEVYDGTFTGALTSGDGVTAQLLKENGIDVFGEGRVDELI